METLPRDSKCPICGENFGERPTVICRDCGTLHHADCWQYAGGCSIYGCSCRRAETFVPGQSTKGCRELCLTLDVKTFAYKSAALALMVSLLGFYFTEGYLVFWSSIFWACLFGSFAFFIGELVHFFFPTYITAFPESSDVSRQYTMLGKIAWWCKPDWLKEGEVKEVIVGHLRKGDFRNEQLHLVYADGRKERLYDRRLAYPWQRLPWSDLCSVAEAIAEATDSSVRIFNEDRRSIGVTSHGNSSPNMIAQDKDKIGKKTKRVFTPETCPACKQLLFSALLQCQRCHRVVHKKCWEETKGCPVQGCDGRTADLPRVSVPPNIPISCSAPIRLREPLLYLGAIGFILALFFAAFAGKVGLVVTSYLLCIALVASIASQTSLGTDLFTWRYTIDPKNVVIKRELKLAGYSILTDQRWRNLAEIKDVHHHWYCHWGTRFEEIYFVDSCGERTLAYSQSSADEEERTGLLGSRDIEGLADRIAEMSDCTVQFIREKKKLL